jgi:hypothetical protein
VGGGGLSSLVSHRHFLFEILNPLRRRTCQRVAWNGFKLLGHTKPLQFRERSGVDVMITIFGDFRQFAAKKLAFFSKTNVMIKDLHYLALF